MSVDASPRNDPCLWLAGDGGDVLEVRVVVQNHGAVVLGDGGGEQVDDPGATMMPPGRHTDLYVPCSLRDDLADRQDDVEIATAVGDDARLVEVPPGAAGLQVDGYTGRCRSPTSGYSTKLVCPPALPPMGSKALMKW
jgi:hypothetical protein